jgi:hypothetical protein
MGGIFRLGALNTATLEDQHVISEQRYGRVRVATRERSVEAVHDDGGGLKPKIEPTRRRGLVCRRRMSIGR